MPSIQLELQDRENIVSYARAIHQGTKTIIQKAAEGYDGLINPSRGANPIAYAIFDIIKHLTPTDEKAYHLAERMYFGSRGNSNHTFPVVPVPLTADVIIPERELKFYGLTLDNVVDGMRYFGADIIKALSYPQEKRMKDRSFRLLTWVFSELEGRHDVRRFYEELPPVKKPIFIDTVISGRASATILQGLDVNRVHTYPIIFVDAQGKRLRPIYRRYFQKRLGSGKEMEHIDMKRILTEDQGAALLGVYAAFYPQILLEARGLGLPHTSAVTWHGINENSQYPSNIPYRETFHSFMNLITSVTKMICSVERQWGEGFDILEDKEVLELLPQDKLDADIQKVLKNIEKYHVPRMEDPDTIKGEFQMDIESARETRSHVIHIRLQKSFLNDKLKNLRSFLFTP